ncbi:type II secretion system F family protein [Amycolatopsis jejuensis]|uniref:type II secretion system F family protein n=1 Tax=Amycolatopsis jejuensis TaxID=330084 RepID=UPI000525F59B|nr:type II secretion system F family protein [Amycolatopsis jejuensis]
MTSLWAGVIGVGVVVALACASAAFLPPPTKAPERRRRNWQRLAARMSLRRTLVAFVAAAAVWWVTGWPVAAMLTAGAVIGVPILVRGRDAQRLITRLDALASWVRRLADVLASGAGGLEQAITSSARTAPAPLATKIEALATRVRTRGLEPALRAFAEDVGDEAADEVVLTLILRARAGGRGLVDILDATATALEREVVARRDIEADRAKPRTDVRAILSITAALLAGLVVFAHEFLTPFNTLLGQLVLAGIGLLLGVAGWWMYLLTSARRPARLLGPTLYVPAGTRSRTSRPEGAS